METTYTFHRVNGVPVQIYDEEIDKFITLGVHPEYGLNYYVIVTSKHAISSNGWITAFHGRKMEYLSLVDFNARRANEYIYEGFSK
jgi:hypothetical protein